jgi:hypothetical protein
MGGKHIFAKDFCLTFDVTNFDGRTVDLAVDLLYN